MASSIASTVWYFRGRPGPRLRPLSGCWTGRAPICGVSGLGWFAGCVRLPLPCNTCRHAIFRSSQRMLFVSTEVWPCGASPVRLPSRSRSWPQAPMDGLSACVGAMPEPASTADFQPMNGAASCRPAYSCVWCAGGSEPGIRRRAVCPWIIDHPSARELRHG